METSLLEARELRKSFGPTQALRGVDFAIAQSEIVAIMGPSGSGKSTLLHCLSGVITPDTGTVYFQDRPISALSEQERSVLRLTDFGFVFQFGQLLPELTAQDNVMIPLLLNGAKRDVAQRESRIWLERLGLEGMEDRLPAELSGGQAQRVAIARAMATRPKVLFADEPTGSLDSLSAENVMNLMLELVRDEGVTVVIITHDARTASYADREMLIRDGQASASQVVSLR